jgi:hypothetical protein
MELGIWLVYTYCPSYILCQIELESKRYGIKSSILNLINQLSCTLDAIIY